MIRLVYQGVDTLDVAVQGALPQDVLEELEAARCAAEAMPNDKYGYALRMGPDQWQFFVKSHGKKRPATATP